LNNSELTAGLRFNEPLPLPFHHTMSVGYVQNHLSPDFRPKAATAWNTEQGFEFNMLMDVVPMVTFQPVVQYYTNVGGRSGTATVAGFRIKVDF
jgi:porin